MKHDTFLNRNPVNRRANEHAFHDFPADWEKISVLLHGDQQPQIIITQNGSRWAGEAPADLAALLEMLASYTLDPRFEEYGNFIDERAISCRDEQPLYPVGYVKFWGYFFTISHGFEVITNDPQVVAEITAAIRANQAAPAYADAKKAKTVYERQRKSAAICR